MIIPSLTALWAVIRQLFYAFYAWLPSPFDEAVILMIGAAAVVLVFNLAMALKNLIFNWL